MRLRWLQWGHRLSPVETTRINTTSSLPTTSFNGATGFRRWKPRPGSRNFPQAAPLQWGHRLSPVETPGVRFRDAVEPEASMGPPAFAGGNAWDSKWIPANVMLQWGHRLSPVETNHPVDAAGSSPRASMGPPAFAGGNPNMWVAVWLVGKGFNGATGFRRWKRSQLWQTGWGGDGLQWGHRLSPVETSF